MPMITATNTARFNVRAYGIWINRKNQVLVTEEQHLGRMIRKFPGGGLNFGEGLVDCLRREWLEELNVVPSVIRHYYTTDFFQRSAFQHDEQVISIYYLVEADVSPAAVTSTDSDMRLIWIELAHLTPDTMTLSIDQHVAGLLQRDFSTMLASLDAA